jgi:hypothetical protein
MPSSGLFVGYPVNSEAKAQDPDATKYVQSVIDAKQAIDRIKRAKTRVSIRTVQITLHIWSNKEQKFLILDYTGINRTNGKPKFVDKLTGKALSTDRARGLNLDYTYTTNVTDSFLFKHTKALKAQHKINAELTEARSSISLRHSAFRYYASRISPERAEKIIDELESKATDYYARVNRTDLTAFFTDE